MKRKWLLIFGIPALSALVVMAGEAILFPPVSIGQYGRLYIAFVGIGVFGVLLKDRG